LFSCVGSSDRVWEVEPGFVPRVCNQYNICNTFQYRPGVGAVSVIFLWPWERKEKEAAFVCVCELMCVSERCVGWEPRRAEGGSWVRAYPMRSNSPISRLPAL
jgi:hypothetical protein